MGLISPIKKSIDDFNILFVYPDKRAVYLVQELKRIYPQIETFHIEINPKEPFFLKNLALCFFDIIFTMHKKDLSSKLTRSMLYLNTVRRPAFIKKISHTVSTHINFMNPKPDLILQWQAIFSPYVGKPKVPFALIIDNYADPPDSPIQKDELRGWSTIYKESFYQLQRELYTNALIIFTLSKWCKEGLCREYGINPQKVFAIGWGAAKNVEVNRLLLKKETTILAIGIDYTAKGLDILLEAAQYLKEFRITIIGKDPRFKQSTVPKNVHIINHVSDEELIRLYSESELFYIFSEFEPSAHVLWEAQAYGCIIVGYDAFGISEAVVDNVTGILLKTRDPFLVAKEIRKLYSNKDVFKQMQNAAIRNYQSNGTWATVCDKLVQNLKGIERLLINNEK